MQARTPRCLVVLMVATIALAGCTTSRFLVETARTVQENSAGSADPTGSGDRTTVALTSADVPEVLAVEEGEATWYGRAAHGRTTASGEIFDQNGMTAAHNGFPFDSMVRVTHLGNGRQVVLRITDRGILSRAGSSMCRNGRPACWDFGRRASPRCGSN